MPRNGQGQYILPPLNPVVPDTVIATAWANGTLDDMALALSTSISTDGQTTPTANLPMGGFNHTGVGPALAFNQYTRADQSQAFQFNILSQVTVDSTFTAYSGLLPLGSGSTRAFTQLQPVFMVAPQNNQGPSTLSINGGPAYPITDINSKALVPNLMRAGNPLLLAWNNGAWVLVTNTLTLAALQSFFLSINGGTLLGPLILSGPPVVDLGAATKKYVDDSITGGTAGVVTFNGRAGAVSLLSADVLTALGYTPLNIAGGAMTGPLTVPAISGADGVGCNRVALTLNSIAAATGNLALNAAFQTTDLHLTGPLTITAINNLTTGNIARVTLYNTVAGNPVTWPSTVFWPMPTSTPPDFTAGPLKVAIVVLELLSTGNFMANAAVY